MSSLIILALILGVPLLLMVLLRVKPLYLFISIAAGYLWAEFLGTSADLALGSLLRVDNSSFVIRLVLLLLPVVLTLVLMRKTLPVAALPFQFALLLANALLLATFAMPHLTPGVQGAIYGSNSGNVLRQAHDVIIAGAAGLNLLAMYLTRPRQGESTGHHGKHRR